MNTQCDSGGTFGPTRFVRTCLPRLAAGLGLLSTMVQLHSALPTSGPIVPELQPLDNAMTTFMQVGRNFAAGSVALMKDGKLVFRQGYGWSDRERSNVVHPDNLFRLASVAKPLTATAIQTLIEEGKTVLNRPGTISNSTPVFAYLGLLPPLPVDPRISGITVKHLLNHKSGWDPRDPIINYPEFRTIQISKELGLALPAKQSDLIRWMLTKPLQTAPGTTEVYFNFNYLLLGRVIEKASRLTYVDYMRDLFRPAGITTIIPSRSRPVNLDSREVWYDDDDELMQSAVDFPSLKLARAADGGIFYETFDAFGGWSGSALDLCKFMKLYGLEYGRRPAVGPWDWDFGFNGSLPGTTAVINQVVVQKQTGAITTVSGLEFAALFNKRSYASAPGRVDEHKAIRDALTNAAWTITSWPVDRGGEIEWDDELFGIEVTEGTPSIGVKLIRKGAGTQLPVKVSYTTWPRTASAADFQPRSGVVVFGPGETVKIISVPIINDGNGESDEQFSVELISASGGAWLGPLVTALVTIHDDDRRPLDRPPTISHAMAGTRLIMSGTETRFNVVATGDAPLNLQWRRNGIDIPGATNSDYIILSAELLDAGNYTVKVVNRAGIAVSTPVEMIVSPKVVIKSGGLLVETYSNVAGYSIGHLMASSTYPDSPSASTVVTSFEVADNAGDNFGVRVSGFIIPPKTGNYRFHLAADDQAGLWLSRDDSPRNLALIAWEPVWQGKREFAQGQQQAWRGNPAPNISGLIRLVAGQRYYVEAIMKDATHADHLSVAWQMPGEPAVANGASPIPGEYLAYLTKYSAAPMFAYDGADYPVGTGLRNLAGGSGWRSEWTSGITGERGVNVESGSLTFPNLRTTGNRFSFSPPDNSGRGAERRIWANDFFSPELKASAEVFDGTFIEGYWLSYLCRRNQNSPGAAPSAEGIWLDDGSFTRLIIGAYASTNWGIYARDPSGPSDSAYSKHPITLGETVFLVVRVAYSSRSQTIRLYVNPRPGRHPGKDPDATIGGFGAGFNRLRVVVPREETQSSIDEIRLGLTYADVAPSEAPPPLIGGQAGGRDLNEGVNEVELGARVAFQVEADGSPSIRFQWRFNGMAITGATQATLTLDPVIPAQAGIYDVVITSETGVVVSAPIILKLAGPSLIRGFQFADGKLRLSFDTIAGAIYGLDFKHDLEDAGWLAVPDVSLTGNGSTGAFEDFSLEASRRYFRLRRTAAAPGSAGISAGPGISK